MKDKTKNFEKENSWAIPEVEKPIVKNIKPLKFRW